MEKSAAFHTLGCKVNRYETDAIAQTFVEAGFVIRDFSESADVYIVNTCTVTGEADRKSRQMLRQARKRNPEALVIAVGCHVEQSDASAYADILIGNDEKIKTVEIAKKTLKAREMGFNNQKSKDSANIYKKHKPNRINTVDSFEEMGIVTSQEETRAFIKIEDGCNNFCSYCIIPIVRGRVRSREESAIIKETEELVRENFQEIVLTGIHICSYGAENNFEKNSLIDLTRKLSRTQGLRRIRFGSLEPQSITTDFIMKAAKINSLCPHFHISLQSGCDSVLKRMNRRYTTQEFEDIVKKLRKMIPDVMITTDIIAGFPGETDEEHQQSLCFCKKMSFLSMHVFKYSSRKGTKAALMKQVDPQTISKRGKDLILLAKMMKQDQFLNAVGKRFAVLIETVEANFAAGYTENYIPAKIIISDLQRGDNYTVGSIVNVTAVGFDEENIHVIRQS